MLAVVLAIVAAVAVAAAVTAAAATAVAAAPSVPVPPASPGVERHHLAVPAGTVHTVHVVVVLVLETALVPVPAAGVGTTLVFLFLGSVLVLSPLLLATAGGLVGELDVRVDRGLQLAPAGDGPPPHLAVSDLSTTKNTQKKTTYRDRERDREKTTHMHTHTQHEVRENEQHA